MSFNDKLSYTEHSVVSPTSDFTIGFEDYALTTKDRINVTVDDIDAKAAGYTVTRKSNLVVTLTPPVPSGVVRLQRETNIDTPFHRFTAGAKFVASNVDQNFTQILHSQQEVRNLFGFTQDYIQRVLDNFDLRIQGVEAVVLDLRTDYNSLDTRLNDETKARKQGDLALKDYVDSAINGITGENFLPITDAFVNTSKGRSQESKNLDFITVEDYGAIGDGALHKLSEKYATLELAKFAYYNIQDRIISLEQSIDWCACQSAVVANSKVYTVKPVYVLNDALDIPKGHSLIGKGCDVWDFPSTTGKPNLMQSGTTLLFVGTPFKKYNVFGVTRNALTGGVITNPSPLETEFSTYELTDFTNQDAVGTTSATLKDLKCGVVLNEASNAALRDIRILKSYNGIDGYNDATLTGIGDDYDIGLLVLNSSFCDFHNVQAVGYWKMFGGVQVNSEHKTVGSSKMGEGTFNLYSKCYFQGLTGFGFRGADEHTVVSNTTNSFTVPYDTSNLIAIGDTLTDGGSTYKAVSLSVSGDLLTITTDSNVPNVGNLLRQVRFNFGVAGVVMRDCVITGLFHKSRLSAKDVGLTKNSCGLEISGGILRDIDFDNVHIFDGECIAFINNVDDVSFNGSYFEAYGIKTKAGDWNASGTRFIVNGVKANSLAKYPIEGCKNITIDTSSEVAATVDLYPSNLLRPARYTDTGLFQPVSFIVDAQGSQTVNRFPKSRIETLISSTGLTPSLRNIRFIDGSFNTLMRVWDNGRVGIGDVASPQGKLHIYTPSTETVSTTHDLIIDAPVAGLQYRSRSGGRWWRTATGVNGLHVSYGVGQSSSYAVTAFTFNPDASIPEFAVTGRIRSTEGLVLGNIPIYEDNIAAKAGGLTVNTVYRNSTGHLMIVI